MSRLAQQDHTLVLQIDGDDAPVFVAQRHENLHRVLLVQQRRELEPDALLFAESVCWRIGDVHIGHFPPDPMNDEAGGCSACLYPHKMLFGRPRKAANCLCLISVPSIRRSPLSIYGATIPAASCRAATRHVQAMVERPLKISIAVP